MTMTSVAAGQESLAERAYLQLRDRLIMLEISPGEPINEAQLAAELGIGRTPIREALKRLETDHLVVSYARRGTFATIVDITELAAISEMRQLLEPLAARKAATHASPEVRRQLAGIAVEIDDLEADRDRKTLMEYDLEVHRSIYRATENHHLQETLVRLDNLATRIWCLVLDRVPGVVEHIREHAALLHAIVDGDADRAEHLASDHVAHFEASVRAIL
ncbi:GntR family transcriptional regulator [Arthrobacter sp. JSM 101049]|uniref:GntR family transcriptional regulator n=1 Tax=Arthrobacter sp. JSM 101049 TaxID=929097 RepID=UPI0035627786